MFTRRSTSVRGNGVSPAPRAPWQAPILAAVGIGGVIGFAAWKVPLGLPGHRALGWLTVLILVRLLAGARWATVVGWVSALLVLELGISPDGIWGVADYAIAGMLVDAALGVRPRMARNPLALALLGAVVLLAVGWIAPLGHSLAGGVPLADLWPSLVSVFGAGLSKLVLLDLAFGATAGVTAWALAATAARARRPASLPRLHGAAI